MRARNEMHRAVKVVYSFRLYYSPICAQTTWMNGNLNCQFQKERRIVGAHPALH